MRSVFVCGVSEKRERMCWDHRKEGGFALLCYVCVQSRGRGRVVTWREGKIGWNGKEIQGRVGFLLFEKGEIK